jgi:YVTN family beta-propeller protein
MYQQTSGQACQFACGENYTRLGRQDRAGTHRRAMGALGLLALAALSSAVVVPTTAWARGEHACSGHLYVANSYSDNVSVIDTHTNEIIDTISVGHNPAEMTFTPDQTQIYVSNSGSNSISVIDVATDTVTETMTVGTFPLGMAFTPDGKRLVVSYEPNVVKIITLASGETTPPITVGLDPEQLRITPDGKYVYVASTLNGIYAVDVDNAQVAATIPVKNPNGGIIPPFPYNLLMSPNGKTLYVGANLGSFMAVIDTKSNAVVDTWPAGSPTGIQYSRDQQKLYVTNFFGATMDEYKASTGEHLRSHSTVSLPSFIAVREDGKYAYFGQAFGTTMTVFNTETWAPEKTLQTGKGANALLICDSPGSPGFPGENE